MAQQTSRIQELESALAAMKRAIGAVSEHRFAGSVYTRTQLEIITILSREPDLPAGTLAERLHLTRGAVTQTVETLVSRSLVVRTPDHTDRRSVRLELTAEGLALAQTLQAERSAFIQRIVGHLTDDEVQATIIAFQKLTKALEYELKINERSS